MCVCVHCFVFKQNHQSQNKTLPKSWLITGIYTPHKLLQKITLQQSWLDNNNNSQVAKLLQQSWLEIMPHNLLDNMHGWTSCCSNHGWKITLLQQSWLITGISSLTGCCKKNNSATTVAEQQQSLESQSQPPSQAGNHSRALEKQQQQRQQ